MTTTIEQSGVCRVCGCTNDRACEGGCTWANHGRTVCSACAFPHEELLFHQTVVEMSLLGPVQLAIDPTYLFALIGELQLALRHPGNQGGSAEIARQFIENVRQEHFNTPALYETIRRGFMAEHDVPREPAIVTPEPAALILPGDPDFEE